MNDPYKVLGVSRDATDDEIKTAYRKLAKKYHPDHNPGNDAAAKRMNEINAAYDAIKSGAADNPYGSNGGAYGAGAYGGAYGNPWQNFYGGGSASQSQNERTEIRAAENYIRSGHFREAMTALDGVEEYARTARWYYLAALANYGLSNKIAAIEYAKIAVEMEPGNDEYMRLLDQLEYGGNMYTSYSSGFPRASFSGGNGLCLALGAMLCCTGNTRLLPFLWCC